jgi:type III secretion protein S
MDVLTYFQQVLWYTVLWSAPALLAATIIGVLISFIQALMQLQDQTLPFFLKLVVVVLVIALTGGWVGSQLMVFTNAILNAIPNVGR